MIVDWAIYEDGRRRPRELSLAQAAAVCADPGEFVWIGVADPTVEELEELAHDFPLHELAIEDAVQAAHQRPKLERFDDTLLLILKPACYVDAREVVEVEEIALFLGEHFLITARRGASRVVGDVREGLERHPDRLGQGPWAAVHALVDRVVDGYGDACDGLEEDLDQVQDEVFRGVNPAQRIYGLQREVLEFHRAVVPLVPALERLASSSEVPGALQPYFSDVLDHLYRVRGRVEGYRALLDGALQANLAQVSVQQNEDMRKISAWVAIAAVPTMIAGIYGMNFEHMPELSWRLGYPMVLAVMAAACVFLFARFKRAGWL